MYVTSARLIVLNYIEEHLVSEQKEEFYGAEITRATRVQSGTLYPMLRVFEERGWLKSEVPLERTTRALSRVYRLTERGQTEISRYLDSYRDRIPVIKPLDSPEPKTVKRITHVRLLVLWYIRRYLIEGGEQQVYSYQVASELELDQPTVWHILNTFEKEGWLTSSFEDLDPKEAGRPPRRYYTLASKGREEIPTLLDARKRKWQKD